MADYTSTLNGQQMDSALIDMAEHNSEAWAVGERNGVPVGSDDVTYQNNAQYYAQQAQSIAPASVTEAVRWDIAQTALTDANKAQARSNIDAGKNGAWSNRNLLDNAYFVGGGSQLGDGVFPINQNGQTSYPGGAFIDRWATDAPASVSAGGIASPAGAIYQNQTAAFTANLLGKTVTASALFDDESIVSGTATLPASVPAAMAVITFDAPTGLCMIIFPEGTSQIFRIDGSQIGNKKIAAAKLELGTVSTLANDPAPDYGEELRKCQRYHWRKTFPAVSQIGTGVAVDASNCVVDVVLPVAMMTGAAISFTANVLLIGAGGSTIASSVSSITIVDNHARLNVVAASALSVNNLYSFFTSTETIMNIAVGQY